MEISTIHLIQTITSLDRALAGGGVHMMPLKPLLVLALSLASDPLQTEDTPTGAGEPSSPGPPRLPLKRPGRALQPALDLIKGKPRWQWATGLTDPTHQK